MKIPSLILRQLYTFGSLENLPEGVAFTLKNRLSDAALLRITEVKLDDRSVPLEDLTLILGEDERRSAGEVDPGNPIEFPLRRTVRIIETTERPTLPDEIRREVREAYSRLKNRLDSD